MAAQKGGRRVALLISRQVALVEFDRHDAQHVFPVGLVVQDLPEFGLGCSPREEEVERLVK